jgi:hypothetical protein
MFFVFFEALTPDVVILNESLMIDFSIGMQKLFLCRYHVFLTYNCNNKMYRSFASKNVCYLILFECNCFLDRWHIDMFRNKGLAKCTQLFLQALLFGHSKMNILFLLKK